MIITYQYYTDTYHGTHFTSATQPSFLRAEKRAEMEVGKYTDLTAENISDNVKMCICSLSEIFDVYENNKNTFLKGVSSESVSGYSVSYGSSASFTDNLKAQIQDEIELWLGKNGGNCRGVGRYAL